MRTNRFRSMSRFSLLLTIVLVTSWLLPSSPLAAAGGAGGGLGGGSISESSSPQVYPVPWTILESDTGMKANPGGLSLLWFPSSDRESEQSDLRQSRSLTLWSARCVGLGLVSSGNRIVRERFGVQGGELVLLVTPSGGEIGRLSGEVTLERVEALIAGEFEARRRIVEDTLSGAKQRAKSDEAAGIRLYREAFSDRCLFPALGHKAAKALEKLGESVRRVEPWLEDGTPPPVEPEFSSRAGERVARALERGVAAEVEGRLDEARRYYEEARSIDRADAVPLRYLGELHRYRTGSTEAATAFFEQILAMPSDPLSRAVALHGLGQIALEEGDQQRGLERFEESVAAFPSALAYRSLAVYRATEGDADSAWSRAQQALSRAPEDPYNQIFVARFWPAQGREDEARQLAQRHGGRLDSAYNLAVVWTLLGDDDKALDLLRRYFEEYHQNDTVRAREMAAARADQALGSLHQDPRFVRLTTSRR